MVDEHVNEYAANIYIHKPFNITSTITFTVTHIINYHIEPEIKGDGEGDGYEDEDGLYCMVGWGVIGRRRAGWIEYQKERRLHMHDSKRPRYVYEFGGRAREGETFRERCGGGCGCGLYNNIPN